MRILICGDREWDNPEPIYRLISRLPPGTVVVEGEARGADKIAGRLARLKGLEVDPYPADWDTYGKSAGPIRNRQMLVEGKPDVVVYFHLDLALSKGTRNMVTQAFSAHVPIYNGLTGEKYAPQPV
jgi:SLOG family YspA-like protein